MLSASVGALVLGSAPRGAAAQADDPSPRARLLTEVGVGFASGLAGSTAASVAAGLFDGCRANSCAESLIEGNPIGAALTMPVGVWLAGNGLGGDGSLLWTALGSGAGWVTVGITGALLKDNPWRSPVAFLPALAGAIAGYELSTTAARPPPRRWSASVAPAPRGIGATVTVAARF